MIAAIEHRQRAQRATVAAVRAAAGRCPWTPETDGGHGGWQCTEDRGHSGDHGYDRAHLPTGFES